MPLWPFFSDKEQFFYFKDQRLITYMGLAQNPKSPQTVKYLFAAIHLPDIIG